MRRKINLLSNENTSLYVPVLCSLFILSISIEKGQDVLWINGHHSRFTDLFFSSITNLGDGLIFIPITLIMLFIRFQYAVMAGSIALIHGLLVSLFKQLLFPGALRPKSILDNNLLHFVPGIDVHGAHSFPSGHTTTIFCAVLFISLVWRNNLLSFALLAVALLVGYSRIYLLQHFLMDVAAGAVVGSFTTFAVWHLFETARKPDWMYSRLEIRLRMATLKKAVQSQHEKQTTPSQG